ncbi:hypothetical protein NDN08_006608 [Rhodosorus marinus]|uniref:MRN complex-interacting protein N-terminal domain-containing protein n=1 Tax=Rhodosorus marinus TaxID=101924 RepID=A0AAV8UI61_9RHOD|nr:hypothetical protein NDN08_006608 [Rhodosorus marinus]
MKNVMMTLISTIICTLYELLNFGFVEQDGRRVSCRATHAELESCRTFQASTLRRDRRFVCKVCGIQQSVRKIIAQSHSAKDIRPVVQKLNRARDFSRDEHEEESEDVDSTSSNEGAPSSDVQIARELPSASRWSRYERQEGSAPCRVPASVDRERATAEPEEMVPSNIPGTEENETKLDVEPSRYPFKPKPVVGIQESRATADLPENQAAMSDVLAEVDDCEWG